MGKKKPTKKPPKKSSKKVIKGGGSLTKLIKSEAKKGGPDDPNFNPPPPPSPDWDNDPLTPDERRFLQNYLIDENGTRAILEIWPNFSYGSAATFASEILRRPHVRAEVRVARNAQVKRFNLRADHVLKEVMRVAFFDPLYLVDNNDDVRRLRDIPLPTRRVISGLERHERTRTVNRKGAIETTCERTTKIRLCSKMEALGMLCHYLGLKTSIPDLSVILDAMPPETAIAVRNALLTPGSNGKH